MKVVPSIVLYLKKHIEIRTWVLQLSVSLQKILSPSANQKKEVPIHASSKCEYKSKVLRSSVSCEKCNFKKCKCIPVALILIHHIVALQNEVKCNNQKENITLLTLMLETEKNRSLNERKQPQNILFLNNIKQFTLQHMLTKLQKSTEPRVDSSKENN